jgi:aspartate 1-decarboxylase
VGGELRKQTADAEEARNYHPTVVLLGESNEIERAA